jgi:ribose transport system substrate-binding protein
MKKSIMVLVAFLCTFLSLKSIVYATDAVITEAIEHAKILENPYSDWDGPTTGPKIAPGKTIAIIVQDLAIGGDALWCEGTEKAAAAAGWKYITMDGQGDATVSLGCFSQAMALGVDGIVTTANTATVQVGIIEALSRGIPTVAIHGSAVVGPDDSEHLLYNNTTSPKEIGAAMSDFVIADSNGQGRVIILYMGEHSIANAKGNAMKDRIEECKTMELLDFVTIGAAEMGTTIPSLAASWISKYGTGFYVMAVTDTAFNHMVSTFRNGGIAKDQIKLVGSDGEDAAYERIRTGEYQIATVPEPSTMFGYMAIDELNRKFNGEEQYIWSPRLHIVTKNNVEMEGVPNNVWEPSNGFAAEYKKIWGMSE